MRVYIISIAAATIISAIISMLTPQRWEKYVGVVTGLAVTICIGQPIIRLVGGNSFESAAFEVERHSTEGRLAFRDEVKKGLESRIESDAKARLKTEFAADCGVVAEVVVTDEGEVREIASIKISGDKIDAAAIGRLREIYGAAEVKYVGAEKTAKKSE